MKRHTIYATDLDHAMDIIQAWQEGKFAALRAAIRGETKGNDMAEFDNSNQIALWAREGSKGVYTGGGPKAEFDGEQVAGAALITRERRGGDKSPIADLVWWVRPAGESTQAYSAAIFKSEDGKLGGSIDDWWVNIYDNRKEEGKGPPFRVKFKAKEAMAAAATTNDTPVEEDDIPF